MSTHAVTDYIHKADISAQEGWCNRPSVSLDLLHKFAVGEILIWQNAHCHL